jgi:hypothetical protein
MIVAKLKGARDRKRKSTGKCEGRKSYAERDPELVDMARAGCTTTLMAAPIRFARSPASFLAMDTRRQAASRTRQQRLPRCCGHKPADPLRQRYKGG